MDNFYYVFFFFSLFFSLDGTHMHINHYLSKACAYGLCYKRNITYKIMWHFPSFFQSTIWSELTKQWFFLRIASMNKTDTISSRLSVYVSVLYICVCVCVWVPKYLWGCGCSACVYWQAMCEAWGSSCDMLNSQFTKVRWVGSNGWEDHTSHS